MKFLVGMITGICAAFIYQNGWHETVLHEGLAGITTNAQARPIDEVARAAPQRLERASEPPAIETEAPSAEVTAPIRQPSPTKAPETNDSELSNETSEETAPTPNEVPATIGEDRYEQTASVLDAIASSDTASTIEGTPSIEDTASIEETAYSQDTSSMEEIKGEKAFQIAWIPFHSEASARGFADKLSEQLQNEFLIVKVAPGQYHVGFEYSSASARDALLHQLEALTGYSIAAGT